MSVNLNELKIGAVAVTNDGKLSVIIGYNCHSTRYPVFYKTQPDAKTTYKAGISDFRAVIGSVDMNALEESTKVEVNDSESDVDDRFLPLVLKGLKIGDTITVSNRGRLQIAIYNGYNPNRPKYPVSVLLNGSPYKAPISAISRSSTEV